MQRRVDGFQELSPFPQVAGVKDGGHVPIKTPKEHAKKGTTSEESDITTCSYSYKVSSIVTEGFFIPVRGIQVPFTTHASFE